jgi:hypothetical protein
MEHGIIVFQEAQDYISVPEFAATVVQKNV